MVQECRSPWLRVGRESSRRASYVQQHYAIDNPLKFKDYVPHCWGITASEGPDRKPSRSTGSTASFSTTWGEAPR